MNRSASRSGPPSDALRARAAVVAGRRGPHRRDLIVVGASGGEGLQQLGDLLGALPSRLAAVVLAVLHRPTELPSHLREVLGRRSNLAVRIAVEGEVFEEGVCYIGDRPSTSP